MELNKAETEQPVKKVWVKPTLESLSIDKTAYWEYRWNDATGFFQEVWVSES